MNACALLLAWMLLPVNPGAPDGLYKFVATNAADQSHPRPLWTMELANADTNTVKFAYDWAWAHMEVYYCGG